MHYVATWKKYYMKSSASVLQKALVSKSVTEDNIRKRAPARPGLLKSLTDYDDYTD